MNRRRRNANRRVITLLVIGSIATPTRVLADIDTEDTATDRVPLYTVIPDYPKEARRDRVEGNVQVCFKITRAGKPWRIAVRKSTARIFEKPAMRAVRQSSFVPLGPRDDVPAIKACRTFRFYLEPIPEREQD